MKKCFLTMAIYAAIAGPASAQPATSTSFSIPSSVIGGGGGSSSSIGFHTDATAGQPSPIMDQVAPPQSTALTINPVSGTPLGPWPVAISQRLAPPLARCLERRAIPGLVILIRTVTWMVATCLFSSVICNHLIVEERS